MSQELSRNFSVLKQKADPPPYFLSYEITEVDYRALSATLGAVDGASDGKTRALDVSVRVGSPKLDNYHRVRGRPRSSSLPARSSPSRTVPNSIKQRLWLETDRAYRAAAERLIRIKTNTQVKVAAAGRFGRLFDREARGRPRDARPTCRFDEDEWRDRVRKLSARFGNYPNVLTSHVSVSAQTDTRYFVNTEGTRIEHGRGFARVSISASAKAADGTDLEHVRDLRSGGSVGPPRRQDADWRPSTAWPTTSRTCCGRPKPSRSSDRRSSPAAPRASFSTRSSATAWKATGRRTRAKARRSPRAWAPRCCPIFFR